MDKCPYCGAAQDTDPGSKYVFMCRTEVSGNTANAIYLRSHICYEAEITALKERLALAEKWSKTHSLHADALACNLRRAEERLAVAEGLLRWVVEHSTDCICIKGRRDIEAFLTNAPSNGEKP